MTGLTPHPPVVDCAGVPITACSRAEAARLLLELVRSGADAGRGTDVHLCNAYTLALADGDAPLRQLLRTATVNFPDGKSVVWANRLRHRGLDLPTERVYGPDLFTDVLDLGRNAGLRHYFLGSTPAVLDRLLSSVGHRYPGALLVGVDSPPFRWLDQPERTEQARRIHAADADVVWVGLGTPKQDHEVARLAADLPAVFVAVGAAFEFVAGTKRQAPLWMQHSGLEWVFRLLTEPRRLWRRYLFGNVRFIRAALRSGWGRAAL